MLSISNLTCERDDRILFYHLNYEFPVGKIVQLEGKNGAGKSTLLRILAGLYSSYMGGVLWGGLPVSSSKIEFNADMLFIGHKSAIKPTLTPLENLRFLIGLHQSFHEKELYKALESVGLFGYEDVLCRNLSAGQQRRVALARLYLSNAKIWLLDEIFTAIDKEGVTQLEAYLHQKAQSGVSIILTTHHQLSISDIQVLDLGMYASREEVSE
tara:strand:- start:37962 stop:38597 length:636 start_codon:yes stop_codon:yes gene_type:complete